jgi:hypothetical protein
MVAIRSLRVPTPYFEVAFPIFVGASRVHYRKFDNGVFIFHAREKGDVSVLRLWRFAGVYAENSVGSGFIMGIFADGNFCRRRDCAGVLRAFNCWR